MKIKVWDYYEKYPFLLMLCFRANIFATGNDLTPSRSFLIAGSGKIILKPGLQFLVSRKCEILSFRLLREEKIILKPGSQFLVSRKCEILSFRLLREKNNTIQWASISYRSHVWEEGGEGNKLIWGRGGLWYFTQGGFFTGIFVNFMLGVEGGRCKQGLVINK